MSTAAAALNTNPVQTDSKEPALPLRSDTLLGVCEAVGQDLGISSTWLRIPFAALLLWNPEITVAAYLALGCVVAVTRLTFPDRVAAQPKPAAVVEKAKENELLAA